jgi:uracil-DNA glycosylase
MDNKITIGECHGTLIEYNGFKVFPLYHPASIIYNRALSEVYQQDLLKLKELL